jgi:hypothetical protein
MSHRLILAGLVMYPAIYVTSLVFPLGAQTPTVRPLLAFVAWGQGLVSASLAESWCV